MSDNRFQITDPFELIFCTVVSLDHMLVFNQKHLNVITRDYVDYYNHNRPHQGLAQSIPIPPDDPPASGEVTALPVLGGLHHHYQRAA